MNITEMADSKLHEKVFEQIVNLNKDSKILVLGAGQGAFEKRLLDAGFKNIVATDINKKNYKLGGVKFIQADLNKDFSKLGKFDLIIAIEIIEHLNSTDNFLKNCSRLLNTNGRIIITTPNIHENMSRLSYFFRGYPINFSPNDLRDSGHINPILDHIFRDACKKNKLKITDKNYNRTFLSEPPVRKSLILVYPILFLLNGFITIFGKNKDLMKGVISIYTIKHA